MKTERIRTLPRGATFTSKYKAAAVQLCRELTARGLTHERFWTRGSGLQPNTFRTYVYAATATRPLRYTVRYQDQTPGARVVPPRKPARPKPPTKECANAHVGCPRPREYSDGYCKRCHDRREYRQNAALRERKRAAAIANGKARRARAREEKAA